MSAVLLYHSISCLNIASCLKGIETYFEAAQISSPVPTFRVLTYPDNLKAHLKLMETTELGGQARAGGGCCCSQSCLQKGR